MANKKLAPDEVYGAAYLVVPAITEETVKRGMQFWGCNMKVYIVESGDAIVVQASVVDDSLLKFVLELRKHHRVVCNVGKPGNPPSCPPGANCNG